MIGTKDEMFYDLKAGLYIKKRFIVLNGEIDHNITIEGNFNILASAMYALQNKNSINISFNVWINSLPKSTNEETGNPNRPAVNKEIESVIKSVPSKKGLRFDGVSILILPPKYEESVFSSPPTTPKLHF